MNRVTPSGYISTADAINEMVNADGEWCRLSALWEQEGWALGARYHEVVARQAVLMDALRAAVMAREVTAVAFLIAGNGGWIKNDMPQGYWAEFFGDNALHRGAVVGNGLSDTDKRRLEGAALCFGRPAWEQWLARCAASSTVTVQGAQLEGRSKIFVALVKELESKKLKGEPHTAGPMVNWLRGEFPDVPEREARDIYQSCLLYTSPSPRD